jgi:hypothetical protein
MELLQSRQIIRDQVGAQPIVIFYDKASDRVRCFLVGALPQEATLELGENRLQERGLGLAWDLSGKPTAGTKTALTSVRVVRQWWLAWSEYHPRSPIYEGGQL